MSAPSNNVYQNGVGQLSGDQLDSFIQWTTNVATLRGFIGTATMLINILGTSSVNDGGQGTFYWNATGTGPDDNGVTNVVPSGSTVGCWTRLGAGSSGGLSAITNNTGLVNISGITAIPTATTLSAWIDSAIGSAQGDILYRDSSLWKVLAPGPAGQFLRTNGAGANPSWASGSSGSGIAVINIQTFSISSVYTPTAGMVYCIVEAVGSGGSGGGGVNGGGGSGGGGGEYARSIFTAAQIGSSQIATIGAAVSGGATGNNGTNGNGTTLGSLLSCAGGSMGILGVSTSVVAGGLGGTSGGAATLRAPGSCGGWGTGTGFVAAGNGGNSYFGAGGLAAVLNNITGGNGLGFGAGGGGGTGSHAGGNSSAGYMIITEFIS